MQTNRIYDYIERLSNLLRIDARRKGAEHGLQPIQLEVLHYLSICNQYSDTPMAVTEYLGQTKGTVSQTLKLLKNKGYLTKYADEHDKRVTHVKVTTAGKKILQDSIPTPFLKQACEALTDKKQTEIVAALDQLLLTLLKSNNMKSFGVCHTCHYNLSKEDGGYFCNLVKQPLAAEEVLFICREHKELA